MSRRAGGQVDEEHLVESPLSQQFGRKRGHVVGGGDHEHPFTAILEPAQEGAEDPGRHASVSVAPGGEALLDLVDPQDRRCHRLGGGEGTFQSLFGLADVFAVQARRVEQEQRHAPGRRDRLGDE